MECEDKTGSGGGGGVGSGGGDGAAVLIPTNNPPVYTIKLLKLCNLLNMPGQENEIDYWFLKHVTKTSG